MIELILILGALVLSLGGIALSIPAMRRKSRAAKAVRKGQQERAARIRVRQVTRR